MKDEYTEKDFARAVKNPFAGKFNGKYMVTVEHEDHEETYEIEMPKIRKLTEQEKVALIRKAE